MKTLVLVIVVSLAALSGWLILSPARVNAVAWEPPQPPSMAGPYAPNEELAGAELIAKGEVYGPEDIAVDDSGTIYGGTQDGYIIRVQPDGRVENWVATGGRPLGLHFDDAGNLIVCDAFKGLLSINPEGVVTVLATAAEGVPFGFTNDLDIASDGKIYFSDASTRWDQTAYMLDLMEGRPYGRLMVYDPDTGETTVLMRNLYFANGVALSQQEDFVLVNETWRYRIQRYWLAGEKRGTSDVFIENLPGFPDGISASDNGTFWLALPTPRNEKVDLMYPLPWLRELVVKLPESIQPKPVAYGFVLGLSQQGKVTYNLQDPSGKHLQEITSVQQHGNYLYFGTLHNDRIGRLAL
jgi:sugar lactone lactonase YvrE